MKDWKAECEKLQGQLDVLLKDREYYRELYKSRLEREEGLTDRFKELLIEVLGRNG